LLAEQTPTGAPLDFAIAAPHRPLPSLLETGSDYGFGVLRGWKAGFHTGPEGPSSLLAQRGSVLLSSCAALGRLMTEVEDRHDIPAPVQKNPWQLIDTFGRVPTTSNEIEDGSRGIDLLAGMNRQRKEEKE